MINLWWVGPGWLPGAHAATHSLPLIRVGGQHEMKKPCAEGRHREITYQLPLGAKQTHLGENQFIAK